MVSVAARCANVANGVEIAAHLDEKHRLDFEDTALEVSDSLGW